MPKPYKKKRNYYRRDPYYYAYVFAPTGVRAWAERRFFGTMRAKALQQVKKDWENLSLEKKARVYEALDELVSSSILNLEWLPKKSPEPSS